MDVSVIVTFYNCEEYVDAALKSVMDQKTSFDFEVIVGDDGSSDGTMAAVQKWIDRFDLMDHWSYREYPVAFWDIFGEQGIPIRIQVSDGACQGKVLYLSGRRRLLYR